ncbi:SAP30-binding protein-like [Lineus longissimus]|uniref:SAP30-binding protein-like n=1 Tax=Lineus longissimus TaxID=88925 RepID=UPI00315DD90D
MSLPRIDSTAAIRSLTMYAGDSGGDDDNDDMPISGSDDAQSPPKRMRLDTDESSQDSSRHSTGARFERMGKPNKVSRLVSYAADELDEDEKSEEGSGEDISKDIQGVELQSSSTSEMMAASRSVHHRSTDEIQLPPEPPGRCSTHLQKKINSFYEKMHKGQNLNKTIQRRKDFRNPSIYEKLIEYCHINEKGTNYPPELYDPSIWGKESFYDELARAQKQEMDKRDKEKKDRTKVEFVSGTIKKSSSTASLQQSDSDGKRKSKWDAQPQVLPGQRPPVISTSGSNPAVISVSASVTGNKTTVISAIGTIKKPK